MPLRLSHPSFRKTLLPPAPELAKSVQVDAASLERRSSPPDPGRSSLRLRQPRLVRHRRLQLSPGPNRSRPSARQRRRHRRRRALPRIPRPAPARGGGTSLAGQCCNVAVVLDFSKYMAGILEIDPERRIARVQPGVILDHLRAAAEASPDLRSRSRHPRPLHARRHDRQQLLRRPLDHGRQDRRQHRVARNPDLRRHPHARRRDQRRGLRAHRERRRPPRRNLCRTESRSPTTTATTSATSFPTFRAASPDTT